MGNIPDMQGSVFLLFIPYNTGFLDSAFDNGPRSGCILDISHTEKCHVFSHPRKTTKTVLCLQLLSPIITLCQHFFPFYLFPVQHMWCF